MKSLTADDRKLIVITVAATVAANLITVVLVALAIITARAFNPQPHTPLNYLAILSVTATPATITLIAFSVRYDLRNKEAIAAKIVRWVMAALGIVATFSLLLLLLGWVGFASGVK